MTDMTVDMSSFKKLYLETARKLIFDYSRIRKELGEKNNSYELQRIFHSIKGQSMAMGYTVTATLSLKLETYFRITDEKKTVLDSAIMLQLPDPQVFLADMDSIEESNSELDLSTEIDKVQKLVDAFTENTHLHLLLVEDDYFFQKLYSAKLQDKSFFVDLAKDGEEAVARMAVKKYDCILLDIIMPKKNGFDVLRYAQENKIIPKTPIIVFSTLGEEQNKDMAMSLGAADFINKGNFDFDQLLSKIDAVINKARLL